MKTAKQIAKEQLHSPNQWTKKQANEMDEREFESEWADIHLPND